MRTCSRVIIHPARSRRALHLFAAALTAACLLPTTGVTPVYAQVATTGSLRGVISDRASGAPVANAVVTVRGPALIGSADATTDVDGAYEISNLPPGLYTLSVYAGQAQVSRSGVLIQLGKQARIDVPVSEQSMAGEVVEIEGRVPIIDQGSTKAGVTITNDYMRNVPTGRNFDEVLEVAPGAQVDQFGTGFGGSSSPENSYVIEGLNVTGVGFGQARLTLPHEFLEEIEVVSGAYGTEFGRSTGGVANVLTRAGGEELRGSVFGYVSPGALSGTPRTVVDESNALTYRRDLVADTDFGVEVGGPLIPDTLWFHAGFSPSIRLRTADTLIEGQAEDTEEINSQTYYFTGKLSYAASPDHGGFVSVFGNPSTDERLFDEFAVGNPYTLNFEDDNGVVAGVSRWTSRFPAIDGELTATLGVYRGHDVEGAKYGSALDRQAVRFLAPRPLADFADFQDVPERCGADGCQVYNYQIGGLDVFTQAKTLRLGGGLVYRQIFDALGRHRVKVGADVEVNRYDSRAGFSGGTRWWLAPGGFIGLPVENAALGWRFLRLDENGDQPCGLDLDLDGAPDSRCSYQTDGFDADAQTLNSALFLQDSWTVLPNLTIEAGVRYERQDVGAADQVVGQINPVSGDPIEQNAFALNNLAPRVGAIYDWTNEGRSRVFGHWGRYYESVPMDLNARALSGEVVEISFYDAAACSDPFRPKTYDCGAEGLLGNQQLGSGGKLIAPGLQGQYMDEIVLGVEYEPLANLKVGAVYTHRDLGRVIEDVSPDGGVSLVLANPGEYDAGAVADLRSQADAARAAGNMDEAARLDRTATLAEGVGDFDPPKRSYDAIELSAVKRFSDDLMGRFSYVYSRLEGNFAGLFSPDTGQLDPNFTSRYDVPELMTNRYGRLASDAPHQIKLDAFYHLPIPAELGALIVGGRFRGRSGRPHNYLADHPIYGAKEVVLLPRGSGERNDFVTSVDLQLTYGRALSEDMGLEVFVSVFNLLNQKTALRRDEQYTFDYPNPVGGGSVEDLEHVKSPGTNQALSTNANFGNPIEFQDPIGVRLGARFTF
ncbi:TonB-dependent receptor domain-containing protein [Haliangium ochraceum]|uniref:TonB-dependent receptor plug n=1 Tax=Haliangium ochraceum (strain DSM 14365 / JCM 11303 / SMP-2) TaxID=502025 RepID=D0LZL3_HALO1|nr:TonB-dependent receptor [Haliangium ochraceum]ACY17992.1 TonB-dependent receptor plug [Haliangium ochraceum DSM 14365]